MALDFLGDKKLKALQAEKENFENLIQQANDLVLVIDVSDGRIHLANQKASQMLGLSREELEKTTLFKLHPPELLQKSAEIIADVWEKGGLVYRNLPLLTAQGELLPVESSAKVMSYRGRPSVVIYARDIREKLRMEEEILEKNRELERLNQRVRELFGKYVSHDVRDTILQAGEDELEGREVEVTVLFCDLRSFTALSEKLGPKGTVHMLNEYFTEMVGAIRQHQGTIDKFIGDAVMAVFGAPIANEAHADYACLAALEMIERLGAFNARKAQQGQEPLKIGIGISSGPVIAGNLGSRERLEYTVVGPTVNLASRLESLTKEKGSLILTCPQTYQAAQSRFEWKEFPNTSIRGVSQAVTIYGLTGKK